MSTAKSPQKQRNRSKTPQEIIIEDPNEVKMRHYEYKPQRKIALVDDQSTPRLYYYARSPMGYHLFIQVSSQIVPTDSETLKKTDDTLPIPHALKKGMFEEVGECILQCSTGICVLTRKPNTTEMDETNYRTIVGGTDQISTYPIVRLGEIVANPRLVTIETSKNIARIRRRTYEAVDTSIQNYQREADTNHLLFQRFITEEIDIASKLSETIKELQAYIQENYKKQTTDEDFMRRVHLNLEFANDKSIHFLELCSEVQIMSERMHKLNVELENIIKTFRNEFRDLNVFKDH